jgi:hypothetical protein
MVLATSRNAKNGFVHEQRSEAESKATAPNGNVLFVSAASAATLRASGAAFTQEVQFCINVVWSNLALLVGIYYPHLAGCSARVPLRIRRLYTPADRVIDSP